MRLLIAAVIALASIDARAFEPSGTWSYSDDRGSLSIVLQADGKCRIAAFEKANGRTERVECSYWLLGSRVRIRQRGVTEGEGFTSLDIQHDQASNTLIVHGDKPRILRRTSGSGVSANDS